MTVILWQVVEEQEEEKYARYKKMFYWEAASFTLGHSLLSTRDICLATRMQKSFAQPFPLFVAFSHPPTKKKSETPTTTGYRRSAVDRTANWRQWWNTLNGSTRILISAMNIIYNVNNFTVLILSEDTFVTKVTRSTSELVLVNSQSE